MDMIGSWSKMSGRGVIALKTLSERIPRTVVETRIPFIAPITFVSWRLSRIPLSQYYTTSRFPKQQFIPHLKPSTNPGTLKSFNIRYLVNYGYNSGVIQRIFLTGKWSPKFHTSTVMKQLLDSIHKLKNSSYQKEYSMLQSIQNEDPHGSYIEFCLPVWNQEVSSWYAGSRQLNYGMIQQLNEISESMEILKKDVAKIFHTYGFLPMDISSDGTKLLISFHNKTVQETESLIADLGIVSGLIHGNSSNNDSLSSCESLLSMDSDDDDLVIFNEFSPVLSQVSL